MTTCNCIGRQQGCTCEDRDICACTCKCGNRYKGSKNDYYGAFKFVTPESKEEVNEDKTKIIH